MSVESKRGFALVISLGMMAFSVLLLLTLSALLRVESSAAGSSSAILAAQRSAILGLLEAVGTLEELAGPDQRVTGTGGLWEDPESGTENYVGVWENLTDGEPATPNGRFLGWLVSREDSTEVEEINFVEDAAPITYSSDRYQTTEADFAMLVGAGSVGQDPDNLNRMNGVVAQKVRVPNDSGMTEENFAWWVGDEGVKAKVNILSPFELNPSGDSYFSEFEKSRISASTAQRSGTMAVEGFGLVEIDDPVIESIRIPGQLEMIDGGPNDEELKRRFHDVTIWSKGILTDVKRGGLKRDLSLLFELDDSEFDQTGEGGDGEDLVYNVLDDFDQTSTPTLTNVSGAPEVTPVFWIDDPQFAPGRTVPGEGKFYGPSWHLLRDYYRLYKEVQGVDSSPVLDAVGISPHVASADESAPSLGAIRGYRLDPLTDQIGTSNWGATARYPRTVQASYRPYISRVVMAFSIEPVGSDQVEFIMLPVVGLHNPYNISIRIRDAHVDWNHLQGRSLIRRYEGETPTQLLDVVSGIAGGAGLVLNLSDGGNPEITFEPGQTIFFLPSGSSVQPWSSRFIDMEPLSATTSLLSVGISLGLPEHFQSDPIPAGVPYQPFLEFFRAGSFSLFLGDEIQSKVDFISADKLFAEGGDYAHSSMATFSAGDMADPDKAPLYDQGDIGVGTPHYFILTDTFVKPVNFQSMHKGFDRTSANPDPVSAFPSFLLGSPHAMSASQDASGGSFHSTGPTYHFVDYYTDASTALHPENVLPAWDNGDGYFGSYHDGTGASRSSFLEVPTLPLHSVGSLRHANLAYNDNMPSLAIGNSFQSQSVESPEDYYDSDLYAGGNAVGQIDFSYALNTALLDGYFFSSIAPDRESSRVDDVVDRIIDGDYTLANGRMIIAVEEGESIDSDTLSDYQKSAAYLQVDGMFNVNSTSIEAWKAFLSSMRDLAEVHYVDANSGSVSNVGVTDTETPFLRISLPNGPGLLKGETDWRDADSWSRFMKLSDVQIEALATEIVEENKRRAADRGRRSADGYSRPSLSVAEFINRDLAPSTGSDILSNPSAVADSSQYGILQTAIEKADLNPSVKSGVLVNDYRISGLDTGGRAFIGGSAGSYGGFQNENLMVDVAASSPNYLTQGDLFQALGPYMSVRSDTFTIRAYGEKHDLVTGESTEAWCEAVVQRITKPAIEGSDPWSPVDNFLGRRFKIVSFRWLDRDDV